MDFQVLKFKFQACNFKQAFLHKLYRGSLTTRKYFYSSFSFGPGCQTYMCKRGISACTHIENTQLFPSENFFYLYIYFLEITVFCSNNK